MRDMLRCGRWGRGGTEPWPAIPGTQRVQRHCWNQVPGNGLPAPLQSDHHLRLLPIKSLANSGVTKAQLWEAASVARPCWEARRGPASRSSFRRGREPVSPQSPETLGRPPVAGLGHLLTPQKAPCSRAQSFSCSPSTPLSTPISDP